MIPLSYTCCLTTCEHGCPRMIWSTKLGKAPSFGEMNRHLDGVVRDLRHPAPGFSKRMCSPLAKGVVQGHFREAEHPTQANSR